MVAQIRLAVLGLGHVAEFQLPAIAAVPDVQLVVACDIDTSREALLREHFDGRSVAFYSDPDRLLERTDIDITLVATPNETHFSQAKVLLSSGRNVAIEKPATTTRHELAELCDLARLRNRLLFFALHQSHGLDVLWFRNEYREGGALSRLGPITGIHCGYYDPYVQAGRLLPAARALGGSWADSGINALSTVAQVHGVNYIQFDHACMTWLPEVGCSEVQGTAHFRLVDSLGGSVGRATIDTNWTLGLNCKFTRLDFSTVGEEVLLHHSRELVLQRSSNGRSRVLVDLASARPRLVSHYIGVFRDLARGMRDGHANTEQGRAIHELLYAAAESGGGPTLCH